jgi:hypothetical protein
MGVKKAHQPRNEDWLQQQEDGERDTFKEGKESSNEDEITRW